MVGRIGVWRAAIRRMCHVLRAGVGRSDSLVSGAPGCLVGRRPRRCCLDVCADVRAGRLPMDEAISVERIVGATTRQLGNPFSFPANAIVGWRLGASPAAYDRLGLQPFNNVMIDVGGAGDARFLASGWSDPPELRAGGSAEDLARLRHERLHADRLYNDALTALDGAIQRLRELPHPPPPYDEFQITPLNERWELLALKPAEGGGWLGWLRTHIWAMVAPLFERQQAFNSALVDHVNRNVASAPGNGAGDHDHAVGVAPGARRPDRLPDEADPVGAADHAVRRHQGPGRRRVALHGLAAGLSSLSDELQKTLGVDGRAGAALPGLAERRAARAGRRAEQLGRRGEQTRGIAGGVATTPRGSGQRRPQHAGRHAARGADAQARARTAAGLG